MTNKEAINIMSQMIKYEEGFLSNNTVKAHKIAIKALEQEPCEDTISRQAVNTLIDELARAISDERCCISRGRSTTTIMRDILHLSSVTPQPKMGLWIDINSKSFELHRVYKCSECGTTEIEYPESIYRHFRYCPNCGVKMQEVEE